MNVNDLLIGTGGGGGSLNTNTDPLQYKNKQEIKGNTYVSIKKNINMIDQKFISDYRQITLRCTDHIIKLGIYKSYQYFTSILMSFIVISDKITMIYLKRNKTVLSYNSDHLQYFDVL